MFLKLLFFILFSSVALAQNTKPLIATDNSTQTCNTTRMVFSPGVLACSGSVATITGSGGGGGSPGGSNTDVQYNNAGSFGGNAGFVYSGGNVGIGTATAGYNLTVNGSAQFQGAGNVGIGTVVPAQALDVKGTAQMTGFSLTTSPSSGYVLTSNSVGIGTWAPATGGGGGGTPGGSNPQLQYNQSGSFGGVVNSGVDSNGNIGIGTSVPGQTLDVSGTVRIIGAGNVGIGSSNPAQALDVQGTVRMVGFNMRTGASNNYLLTSDASGNGSWAAAPSSSQWSGTNPIYFNGNVGINSTIPGQSLDVVGTVRATGFIAGAAGITLGGVNHTSWPGGGSTTTAVHTGSATYNLTNSLADVGSDEHVTLPGAGLYFITMSALCSGPTVTDTLVYQINDLTTSLSSQPVVITAPTAGFNWIYQSWAFTATGSDVITVEAYNAAAARGQNFNSYTSITYVGPF
jgi:hypothetical protein